jgi:hypothetical protein
MLNALSQINSDLRSLRDSWRSVRGGWRGARQDAAQLVAHRRLLVDTTVITLTGTQVVMRTRLRLSGDVQTDILRGWLNTASAATIEQMTRDHFRSVAAAAAGWGAVMSAQRLGTRLTILIGSVGSVASTILTLLQNAPNHWLDIILMRWWLLSGFGLALLGAVVRWVLRLWLRARFRHGLTAAPL